MANFRPVKPMKSKETNNQFGFTIVELLMATAVFSIVLLIITTGIIKIGQSYYKGLIQNKTQETTRNISEDISRTIQLASGQKVTPNPADPNRFCVGTVRYTAYLNEKVDGPVGPITSGLKAESVPPNDCSAPDDPNAKQLLAKNMRLLRFKVDPADPLAQTWRIDIRVGYGDNDLLTHYNDNGAPLPGNIIANADSANCKSGVSGGSFCATAQLNNLVKKRLKNE